MADKTERKSIFTPGRHAVHDAIERYLASEHGCVAPYVQSHVFLNHLERSGYMVVDVLQLQRLRDRILELENDIICTPENTSVAEYVGILENRIADLNRQIRDANDASQQR